MRSVAAVPAALAVPPLLAGLRTWLDGATQHAGEAPEGATGEAAAREPAAGSDAVRGDGSGIGVDEPAPTGGLAERAAALPSLTDFLQ